MTDEVKSEPRDYIVLVRQNAGSPQLTELGLFQAGGAHAAIRKAVEGSEVDLRRTARYIAIPVRNWTETEGGLDKPKPKFRLTDKAYVPPAEREVGSVQEEPVEPKAVA